MNWRIFFGLSAKTLDYGVETLYKVFKGSSSFLIADSTGKIHDAGSKSAKSPDIRKTSRDRNFLNKYLIIARFGGLVKAYTYNAVVEVCLIFYAFLYGWCMVLD